MLYCSINGVETDVLSVSDRSTQYGDGVFTTAKTYQGKVVWLAQHLARLQSACQHFGITKVDWQHVTNHLEQLAVQYPENVIKVIISAGQQSNGYARAVAISPSIIIMVNQIPSIYSLWRKTGIKVGLATCHVSANSTLAGYKHLNRLEQVMLKEELLQTDFQDLFVTNDLGYIIEAISANVFVKLNHKWFTPKLNYSGVNGLARQHLLTNFPTIEVRDIAIKELVKADAMFITNCLMPAIPISHYNHHLLDIDACKPFIDSLLVKGEFDG